MPWLQIVKRSQPRCKRSCWVDLAGWLRKCHHGEFTVEMFEPFLEASFAEYEQAKAKVLA